VRKDSLSLALAAAAIATLVPLAAVAQQMPLPAAETPMLDPYVPPSARPKTLRVPAASEGSGLQAQVERKLRARFEAAANGNPALTREQARAAGLGSIDQSFEAIDRAGRGSITFDDYRRYLQEQRAGVR
jgi:hypothetical protein